jgi:hypothetical protein
MTNSVTKVTIALGFSFALAACNQPTDGSSNSSLVGIAGENSLKVSLDAATLEQITPYVSQCQGHKLCVQICHRPPGNPENSRTLQLPLAATPAHLNHGGPHDQKDYLGACDAADSGGDDTGAGSTDGSGTDGSGSGTTDGGGTDNTGDGTGGGSVTGGSTLPPLWCQTYYDIDQNCDGINDQTGESLL